MCYANSVIGIMFNAKKSSHFGENLLKCVIELWKGIEMDIQILKHWNLKSPKLLPENHRDSTKLKSSANEKESSEFSGAFVGDTVEKDTQNVRMSDFCHD